jgi:hypothetical protein
VRDFSREYPVGKSIICILFFLIIPVCSGPKTGDSIPFLENRPFNKSLLLAVLPISDVSNFKGKWNLRRDVPAYIAKELSTYYKLLNFQKLISYTKNHEMPGKSQFSNRELKKIATEFNLNYLLLGRINKYFTHKTTTGIGSLGGAKHYISIIHYDLMLYDSARDSIVLSSNFKVRKQRPLLRINYYKLSEDEDQYLRLKDTEFGSALFDSTIAGSAMKELCKKIDEGLTKFLMHRVITEPEPARKQKKKVRVSSVSKIVSIDSKDTAIVYLNSGFKDNIYIGEKFDIFSEGEEISDPETGRILGRTENKVGELVIDFIKADHFCKAKITKRDGPVTIGCFIHIK